MFINNYIGNLHSQKEFEINQNILLDLTKNFKVEHFTSGATVNIHGVRNQITKKSKPTIENQNSTTLNSQNQTSKGYKSSKMDSKKDFLGINIKQDKQNRKKSNFKRDASETGLKMKSTHKSIIKHDETLSSFSPPDEKDMYLQDTQNFTEA